MVPTTRDAVADRFSMGQCSKAHFRHLTTPSAAGPSLADPSLAGGLKVKDREPAKSLAHLWQMTISCASKFRLDPGSEVMGVTFIVPPREQQSYRFNCFRQ